MNLIHRLDFLNTDVRLWHKADVTVISALNSMVEHLAYRSEKRCADDRNSQILVNKANKQYAAVYNLLTIRRDGTVALILVG